MAEGELNQGALSGFRVLDLTRILSGPYCTQMLADHGADVIKVEPPGGDEVRTWGPPFRDGTASYFVGINRNKRMVALDLSGEEGREILLKLIEGADALIENYKPGSLKKWGLDYETVLKPRFPKLIYCKISGFGEDGPLGGLPGYDAAVQAIAGPMSINGTEESGPIRVGTPLVDICAGMNAAIGILMAAEERRRSGEGQALEVTLYDTAISLLHPHAANYFMNGKRPKLIGNSHPNICPYDQYKTAGKPVFLAVGNDRQFSRLVTELGRPEMAEDPRYRTNGDRVQHRHELNGDLQALLRETDGETLAMTLVRKGVPAAPVLDIPEIMAHPHTEHRKMVLRQGSYSGTGIPIKMQRTEGALRHAPQPFGRDTEAVLHELGYSADQVRDLLQKGIAFADTGLKDTG